MLQSNWGFWSRRGKITRGKGNKNSITLKSYIIIWGLRDETATKEKLAGEAAFPGGRKSSFRSRRWWDFPERVWNIENLFMARCEFRRAGKGGDRVRYGKSRGVLTDQGPARRVGFWWWLRRKGWTAWWNKSWTSGGTSPGEGGALRIQWRETLRAPDLVHKCI